MSHGADCSRCGQLNDNRYDIYCSRCSTPEVAGQIAAAPSREGAEPVTSGAEPVPEVWTTNIQWKGTDLCMDFICPSCGAQSHFDGSFIYTVKCKNCGRVYELATDIPVKEISPGSSYWYDYAAVDDECEPA